MRRAAPASTWLVAALVLGWPAPARAQDNTAFELINRSTIVIEQINLSAVTAKDWGRDWLGDRVLNPGGRVALNPGTADGCIYDVRVIYRGGKTEEKRRQNLCDLSELIFDASNAITPAPASGGRQGQANTPIPDFNVVNGTTRTITQIFVSGVNDSGWGDDRLPDTLASNAKFLVRLPRDGQCEYDVRVVYDNRMTEERRRQNVCQIEDMVFNGENAQAPAPATPGPGRGQPSAPAPRGNSYGTGFFVTSAGHALTNFHVVEGCRAIGAMLDGIFVPATVVRSDERNDLSLIRVQVTQQVPFARFRGGGMARPGDGVVVAGYPLQNVLQNGLNVTVGNVSSLAGLGGNTALVQISAPVQPGNSGGPLMDLSGSIIGVVVSKLDAQRIAEATGDIPQNVNFAVHGSVARLFVESTGQRTQDQPAGAELRASQVGDLAQQFTFQISCRNN